MQDLLLPEKMMKTKEENNDDGDDEDVLFGDCVSGDSDGGKSEAEVCSDSNRFGDVESDSEVVTTGTLQKYAGKTKTPSEGTTECVFQIFLFECTILPNMFCLDILPPRNKHLNKSC